MEETKDKPANSYRAIFDAANDAILVLDMETGRIIDANRAACEMFCYPPEEILRLTVYDLSVGEASYTPEEITGLINKTSGGESQLFEWLVKDKAERLFWIEVNLKRAIIDGKYRLLAIVRDITERKNIEEALRESEERYKLLIDNIPAHIAAIDQSGRFIVWNRYSEKLLGYTGEEAMGKMSPLNVHESKEDADEVVRIAAEKGIYDKEINLVHKNGSLVPVRLVVVPYRNNGGNITSFHGFAADISEQKRAEGELVATNKKMKQLALKDFQTGLYNYRYLEEFIEIEFYRARRYVHPLSVIMFDIDYFKSINDLYGHEFGDLVIKQLAKYLRKMVRRYDPVIRFGGEEFVVISSGVDRARAMPLAQRLLDAINLYNFGDSRHMIKLKVSAAVSSYPEDKITKGMDLINIAGNILNKVKEKGGNILSSSLDLKSERQGRTQLPEPTDVKFLREKIEKLNKRGRQSLIESIFAFAKTIELKDHYTAEHTESTVHYSTGIGKELKLFPGDIENIRQASVLHDLGKIGISDKILRKKSKLTKKEFEEIKKHPQIAADIIRPIHFMHDIIPLVLYHHERWDGKGYPAGLKGEEIPIGARIIAIADVYQALTSNRPYHKAYHKKDAIDIIKKGSGTQFDPRIVKTFLMILNKEKNGKRGNRDVDSERRK